MIYHFYHNLNIYILYLYSIFELSHLHHKLVINCIFNKNNGISLPSPPDANRVPSGLTLTEYTSNFRFSSKHFVNKFV